MVSYTIFADNKNFYNDLSALLSGNLSSHLSPLAGFAFQYISELGLEEDPDIREIYVGPAALVVEKIPSEGTTYSMIARADISDAAVALGKTLKIYAYHGFALIGHVSKGGVCYVGYTTGWQEQPPSWRDANLAPVEKYLHYTFQQDMREHQR